MGLLKEELLFPILPVPSIFPANRKSRRPRHSNQHGQYVVITEDEFVPNRKSPIEPWTYPTWDQPADRREEEAA